MVGAGKDDAEGFAGAIGEEDGVGDDFSIEVDISCGDGGDVFELHDGVLDEAEFACTDFLNPGETEDDEGGEGDGDEIEGDEDDEDAEIGCEVHRGGGHGAQAFDDFTGESRDQPEGPPEAEEFAHGEAEGFLGGIADPGHGLKGFPEVGDGDEEPADGPAGGEGLTAAVDGGGAVAAVDEPGVFTGLVGPDAPEDDDE